MNNDKRRIIESLVQTIPELTAGQLHWIHRVVSVYSADHKFILNESDLFDESTIQNFGDAMRVHHSFSSEPFSKDKFEYVLVNVLKMSGHKAELAPKGNPGHDATVDGIQLSLKTQADKNIKEDTLWISKFMELGKGNWGDDPSDLKGLRDQFLRHMAGYEKILSLRTVRKAPNWKYELIEIPINVLQLARGGELEMKINSKQYPKPGYCYVRNEHGKIIFNLYFDGGGERKLQIKNLDKNYCRVHATWEFFIPQE
ncbi:MAG: restriction endonuclease [Gammaproteobacteria bacterium]|nr:restriction endonuclease [Gammaproteobacteria bacterium]